MKLFDLQPKTRREDLFDRERELQELHSAIEKGYPLIALLGIRRIGKTSVLKVLANEVDGVYLDMRGLVKRDDMYMRVADAMSSNIAKMKKLLEGIRGVEVAGLSLEIRWKGRDSLSLAGLLTEINKKRKRFVVMLDEVQNLRPPLSAEVKNLIAYSYDNLEHITFIVAGSEIGLLREFLGTENPSSPLYGRGIYEVSVERFSRGMSEEFLRRGFREEGFEPPEEEIREAVEFFDGIIGWLVLFGRKYIDGKRRMDDIREAAVELALSELSKLSDREKMVLEAIANGKRSWSDVRKYIGEKFGIVMPKSTLSRMIDKMEKLSILENYEFLDHVYREAAKRLRVRL
ncbi:MAG: AAA family ATPase [Fervidicoccaceae archaeon]